MTKPLDLNFKETRGLPLPELREKLAATRHRNAQEQAKLNALDALTAKIEARGLTPTNNGDKPCHC